MLDQLYVPACRFLDLFELGFGRFFWYVRGQGFSLDGFPLYQTVHRPVSLVQIWGKLCAVAQHRQRSAHCLGFRFFQIISKIPLAFASIAGGFHRSFLVQYLGAEHRAVPFVAH